MALVAYDNSDSSEFEDEGDENVAVVTLNKKVEEPSSSEAIQNDEEESTSSLNLFNFLPQPTNKKPAVVEEDDEFLHKKESNTNTMKPKAKITVPSLSDFKDVENRPTAKPKTSNGKKSGLLSMLPQPKNAVTISTKSLIPHVLTRKPTATAKKKEPLPSPLKKAKSESTALVNSYSDESDNDDEVQNDFFSIHKPVELPIEDVPLELEKPTEQIKTNQKKPVDIQSYFKQDEVELQAVNEESTNESAADYYSNDATSSSYNGYAAPQSLNNDAVLDEEAILKLCGTRGKRKREDIQIVDVNQQDVLADAREWLLKGLMDDTSKRVSSSKKRGDEPTSQQRRKHQITYLAHQAKANEVELQNQWANNRMSKRQTQSKYGF